MQGQKISKTSEVNILRRETKYADKVVIEYAAVSNPQQWADLQTILQNLFSNQGELYEKYGISKEHAEELGLEPDHRTFLCSGGFRKFLSLLKNRKIHIQITETTVPLEEAFEEALFEIDE